METSRCIYPYNPESAKLTFTLSAITVSIKAGLSDRVLCCFKSAAPGTIVAFGLLDYLAMSSVPWHRAICSWHTLLLQTPSIRRAFFSSDFEINPLRRILRLTVLARRMSMCLWFALLRLILPLPVNLNRFAALRLVFILGIQLTPISQS